MNKTITEADLTRIKRCIVEMNNKQHFYETSGIATRTVDRILERGYAKEDQLKAMLDYCDKVEPQAA